MISSTLGLSSGSQHPIVRAKHFEAVFTAITSQISSSITHRSAEFFFFFGIGTRDVMILNAQLYIHGVNVFFDDHYLVSLLCLIKGTIPFFDAGVWPSQSPGHTAADPKDL